MFRTRMISAGVLGALVAGVSLMPVQGQDKKADASAQKKEAPKDAKQGGTWTNPNDPSLPVDFKFQGEYVGAIDGGGKLGAQVIALGNGAFQAVLTPGGLPGAGWDGKNKILMHGDLTGTGVQFKPAMGNRKYLAQSATEFAATEKFPPEGQKDYTGEIMGDVLKGKSDDGKSYELKKTVRVSPTLGAKPPQGAVVLFNGTDASEFIGGRLDKETSLLNTDGKDIKTQRKFNDYTVHVEFLLPYRPDARGQGRGNSGFYQVHHYEVQILDSFGLAGKNNECGGVYTKLDPNVNACLPPLQWQTYDIDFTNARREGDKVVAPAKITARLNGIVIHDDAKIAGPTGGSRNEPEGTPGPLLLQGHGNPLQFRNIWIVEKK